MSKTIISTPHAPAAIGPYSQATRIGNLVFTAGQIPIVPALGKITAETIEEQTHQVCQNLRAILHAAGTDLAHVLKTTVFLSDFGNFARMNAVYGEYFSPNAPARSTVEVSKLPMNALLEIECVAVIPD
ncbi:MAG TPA: RidA family protein [Anaerolineales bacterium]|nr:RidA family protein [Anaerolineales bacterium]